MLGFASLATDYQKGALVNAVSASLLQKACKFLGRPWWKSVHFDRVYADLKAHYLCLWSVWDSFCPHLCAHFILTTKHLFSFLKKSFTPICCDMGVPQTL